MSSSIRAVSSIQFTDELLIFSVRATSAGEKPHEIRAVTTLVIACVPSEAVCKRSATVADGVER